MKLEQATVNFAKALVDLIGAAVGIAGKTEDVKQPEVKTEVKATPANPAKQEGAAEWPKNFSIFRTQFFERGERTGGALGEIFNTCSAVKWSPELVEFVVMASPEFAPTVNEPATLDAVREILANQLGFAGNLVMRCSGVGGASAPVKSEAPKEIKKAGRPKKDKAADDGVTAQQVVDACLAMAEKCGKREPVLELLKQFGGTKVSEIDPAKYPMLLAAAKSYGETTANDFA